jgi:hypothetical protein
MTQFLDELSQFIIKLRARYSVISSRPVDEK